MSIPDPGSWFLPIPDPGSKNSNKRKGWKKFVVNFLCTVATNFTKLEIILVLKCRRKKNRPIYKELENFLPKKLSLSSQKYGLGIRDLGSGKNLVRIPESKRHRITDPDHCIFFLSAYYFLKVHLHHLLKIKSQKESQNSRNQGFSYHFCMMIEGSGSRSITLTDGSGSGRPKNMRIRWNRIRNTDLNWSEQTEFRARITSRKVYNTLKINLLFPVIKYYWYVIYIYKFCIMFLEPVRWRIRLSLKIISNFVISRHRCMTRKSPVLHYKCHLKMLPKVFKIQLFID